MFVRACLLENASVQEVPSEDVCKNTLLMYTSDLIIRNHILILDSVVMTSNISV